MAYRNPLAACEGSISLDGTDVKHVTNVEVRDSGTNPRFISSDSGGERLAVGGCDEREITFTCLVENNEDDIDDLCVRGTVYTVVAEASGTLETANGDYLCAEIRISEPINEGDFVSVDVTMYGAKKDE